jgi:hypothetical protein
MTTKSDQTNVKRNRVDSDCGFGYIMSMKERNEMRDTKYYLSFEVESTLDPSELLDTLTENVHDRFIGVDESTCCVSETDPQAELLEAQRHAHTLRNMIREQVSSLRGRRSALYHETRQLIASLENEHHPLGFNKRTREGLIAELKRAGEYPS